ncbi:glycosyltransferase family 2 protein [Pseudanabaena biceps]|nr:glycosyltransferase family 2 protein [Pseudanabaena biceps]
MRKFVKLNNLIVILKTKGLRHASAKILKKIYLKLNDSFLDIDFSSEALSFDVAYSKWLNKNFPREADFLKMAEILEIFSYKPVISIIMPVFDSSEQILRETIKSVINQVYPYWELCIADASANYYVNSVLQEYVAKDSRIKIVSKTEDGNISQPFNSALDIASGEFIALLAHDDLLTRDALYEVALLLNRHPQADMIYSDEDKLLEDGSLSDPFFKPDWCPDSLLSRMYTANLGTYRRSIVTNIGGFRAGYEGSQDYDLVLRLTEKTENIFHIPKILYHSRFYPHPKSNNSYNDDAQKAIADALQRRNESGKVIPISDGYHIVRYDIRDFKLVSIIIPTKNLGKILNKCLISIFDKTQYPSYEVLVIDNGSDERETLEILNYWKLKEPNRFRCEKLDIPFNYSKINNYAANLAKGEYLLFLNNDTEVITNDWIEAMVEQAQRTSIGAVGTLLLYPDNTIQHAGVILVYGVAGHSHKNYSYGSDGYFKQIQTINNYSAVTAACLMCRREVFEAVGGFEKKLAVEFNDVDFCLKICKLGYRNVYLPHVVLYHYESKSRGLDNTPEKLERSVREIEYMKCKWKEFIDRDPCYSPNLTRQSEDFSIKI